MALLTGFPVEILAWGGTHGGDKDLMGGDSRVIRDNFPRPTIKGQIRYQDDNVGLKESLIVNIQVLFCIFS